MSNKDKRNDLINLLTEDNHNEFEIKFLESIKERSSLTSNQKYTLDKILSQYVSKIFYEIKR